MIHIEQFGSDSFYLKDLPKDNLLNRYELVELLRDAVEKAGINPQEFLDSSILEQFSKEYEEGLF